MDRPLPPLVFALQPIYHGVVHSERTRNLEVTERSNTRVQPVTAVIPAAGKSSRFGRGHKLVAMLGGRAVVAATLERVCACPVDAIVIVTGYESQLVERAVSPGAARIVRNPNFERGLASSIVCGVESTPPDHHLLIWPADMPLITPASAAVVLEAGGAESIVVPVFEGRRGHPVLFGRSFRNDLRSLKGDRGAREVLSRHSEAIVEVEVTDQGTVFDLDTPADLRSADALLGAIE